VTGAASGIGRATARRLAADGAAVVVDHLGDAEAAGVLVAEIERDGGRAFAVEADVADEAQVDAMFARAQEELGRSTCSSTTPARRSRSPCSICRWRNGTRCSR